MHRAHERYSCCYANYGRNVIIFFVFGSLIGRSAWEAIHFALTKNFLTSSCLVDYTADLFLQPPREAWVILSRGCCIRFKVRNDFSFRRMLSVLELVVAQQIRLLLHELKGCMVCLR